MRSRRELEQRLLRAGFDPGEVSDEIERLEAVGLIDDAAFAKAFTEQAVTGGKGARAISSGLVAKGIDRATIDEAIAGCTEGESDRAATFAASRARRMRGLPSEKAYQRLVGALMRRGFDPETSRGAARRALAIDADEG
jgi:regulatory protein